jgi:hypothetical protein
MSRIRRIEKFTIGDGPDHLSIRFTANGIEASITLQLPSEWDTWDRATKIAWGRQQLAAHLAQYNYATAGEIIYPDTAAPEQAASDFGNLPGWATWTAAEATAWIDANVVDLASAKTTLEAMAKAIVYLRDMVLER